MTQPASERPVAVRPLLYDRLRLYLNGQATFVGEVLDRELTRLYEELEQSRTEHEPERAVEAIKDEIVHVVNARRDITTGLLDDRLEFLKVRLYRGGQADTISATLLDEQDRQLETLAGQRAAGLLENSDEIIETRNRLVWLTNALRDLGTVRMSLAGPDVDPR